MSETLIRLLIESAYAAYRLSLFNPIIFMQYKTINIGDYVLEISSMFKYYRGEEDFHKRIGKFMAYDSENDITTLELFDGTTVTWSNCEFIKVGGKIQLYQTESEVQGDDNN